MFLLLNFYALHQIAKKYHSKRWQRLRKQKLILNPICERCAKREIYVPAYFIHHKEYVTDKNYEDDNVYDYLDSISSSANGRALAKVYYTALGRERYSMYKVFRNGEEHTNQFR